MCAIANGTPRGHGPPDRERRWADPANLAFTFDESEYSSESIATQPGERQVREKPTNFGGTAVNYQETSPTNAEGIMIAIGIGLGLFVGPWWFWHCH
jgi:hypothetical protein